MFFTLGAGQGSKRGCLPRLCRHKIHGFMINRLPTSVGSFRSTGFLRLTGPLGKLRGLTRGRQRRFRVPIVKVANDGKGAVIGR